MLTLKQHAESESMLKMVSEQDPFQDPPSVGDFWIDSIQGTITVEERNEVDAVLSACTLFEYQKRSDFRVETLYFRQKEIGTAHVHRSIQSGDYLRLDWAPIVPITEKPFFYDNETRVRVGLPFPTPSRSQ